MSQSHIASLAESDRNDARPRAECAERHREKERHDPVQTAGNDQHNQKGARCAEFLAKRCVIRNSKAPSLSPREKPTWLCESKLQHSCGTDVDADPVQTAGNDQHNQKGARCAEFLAKRCVIRNSKAPPLSPREKPTWLCESKLQHSCGTDVDAFCGTDVDAIFCGTDVDAILLLAGAKLPLGDRRRRILWDRRRRNRGTGVDATVGQTSTRSSVGQTSTQSSFWQAQSCRWGSP